MAADRIAKLEEAAGAAKSMPVPQQELAEADDESPGGAPDVAAPEATASSQAPDPAIDSEWVETSGAVNVRASPAPNAQTIKIAEPGTRYRATGRKGRWVQVMDPKTSEVGWVYSRFVAASGAP